MQIHELTRRKLVQEASLGGAAGGAWALAKGVASKVASQAITKATGMPDDRPAASSSGNSADAAGVYTQQQAQPLAMQIQKAWAEMVQAQLKSAGATTLAQIDPADSGQLKTQLTKLVNSMINANSYSGPTYDNLAASVATDDPAVPQAAKMTSDTITKAINDIWAATATPTTTSNATATAKMFLTLAQSGILPAQHLLKFYPKSGTISNDATTAKSAPIPPGGQKLAKALKADMASLPAAQALAQANPDEAIKQFRELMGLK